MKAAAVWLLALCSLAALFRRVPLTDTLYSGIREGLRTLLRIFPPVAAMLAASYMLRASGALTALETVLQPLLTRLGLPPELVGLMLIRPLSGSAALGVARDTLQSSGADSRAGRIAAVMLASTETTFYVFSLYSGALRIKRPGRVLPAALVSLLTAFLLAPFFCRVCFPAG